MHYPIGKIIGIENGKFFGTGFVFYSKNIVLTCDHVILDAKHAKVDIGFELSVNGKVYPLAESRGNAVSDFRFLFSMQEMVQEPLQPGSFLDLEPTNIIYPQYYHHDKNDYISDANEIRACGTYNNGLGNVSFLEFISEDIIEGASGGPVLNRENQVVAIVSQLFKETGCKVDDYKKICKAYSVDVLIPYIGHVLKDIELSKK